MANFLTTNYVEGKLIFLGIRYDGSAMMNSNAFDALKLIGADKNIETSLKLYSSYAMIGKYAALPNSAH